MSKLDDSNFLLYAAANYDNQQYYDVSEFNDDISRFKYLKRLFYRYDKKDELKERLILNHLIIIYNVFKVNSATRMLFFKIEKEYWSYLKTFLVYLNYMPDTVLAIGVEAIDIHDNDISLDKSIVERLREL